jgi:hypothetical protein
MAFIKIEPFTGDGERIVINAAALRLSAGKTGRPDEVLVAADFPQVCRKTTEFAAGLVIRAEDVAEKEESREPKPPQRCQGPQATKGEETMPLTSRQIADKWREVSPEKAPFTWETVYDLLLLSLSPRQRQVYDYVSAQQETEREWVTSADICAHLGIKANNAGNILKQLHDLGLLKREPAVGEGGLYYLWAIA